MIRGSLIRWLAVVVIGLSQAGPTLAAAADEMGTPPLQLAWLPNGMLAAVSAHPDSNVVAIAVSVGGGERGADANQVWLAHFVEHFFFEGTPRRPGPGDFWREVESLGASSNAEARPESTVYHIVVPSSEFESGLDLLADMLVNARFPEDQFLKVRQTLQQELIGRQEDPITLAQDTLFSAAFTGHPVRTTVMTHAEALDDITMEAVLAYRDRYYVTENMVVAVAGNVDAQFAIEKLSAAFADARAGARPILEHMGLPPVRSGLITLPREGNLAVVSVGVPVTGFSDPDRFALRLLADMLGSGFVYSDLVVNRGIASDVRASYWEMSDVGLLSLTATTTVDHVKAVVDSLILSLFFAPPTCASDRSLSSWSTSRIGADMLSRESMQSQAYDLADGLSVGYYLPTRQYDHGLRALNCAAFRGALSRQLQVERAILVTVGGEWL